MAIPWKRAAAVLLCAVCPAAAALGLARLTALPPAADVPSAAARMISPTIEPASISASLDPAVMMHLRLSELAATSRRAAEPAGDGPAGAGQRTLRRDAATHTVAAGETLWNIARAAGVNVGDLAAANSLAETGLLPIGRVLTLPAAGSAARMSVPPARAMTSRTGTGRSPTYAAATVAAAAQPRASDHRVALTWPSRGVITSRFGWRIHPIFGGREFHTGMDIGAHYGSPVVAARGGVVRFVGWKTGYGRIIIMEHDGGLETSYSHLSAAAVSPGDHVAQGQVIGRVGSTGWSTGPHLLFEVRRNGVPVDPAPYLN